MNSMTTPGNVDTSKYEIRPGKNTVVLREFHEAVTKACSLNIGFVRTMLGDTSKPFKDELMYGAGFNQGWLRAQHELLTRGVVDIVARPETTKTEED